MSWHAATVSSCAQGQAGCALTKIFIRKNMIHHRSSEKENMHLSYPMTAE